MARRLEHDAIGASTSCWGSSALTVRPRRASAPRPRPGARAPTAGVRRAARAPPRRHRPAQVHVPRQAAHRDGARRRPGRPGAGLGGRAAPAGGPARAAGHDRQALAEAGVGPIGCGPRCLARSVGCGPGRPPAATHRTALSPGQVGAARETLPPHLAPKRRGIPWRLLLLAAVPVSAILGLRAACPSGLGVLYRLSRRAAAGRLDGKGTEHCASDQSMIGGLLNATFGNAAELIIAILALRAGLVDLSRRRSPEHPGQSAAHDGASPSSPAGSTRPELRFNWSERRDERRACWRCPSCSLVLPGPVPRLPSGGAPPGWPSSACRRRWR